MFETAKQVLEAVAFMSVAATSAVFGGFVLVALRVTFSPRRRRQFQRLWKQLGGRALRMIVVESPEVGDDTRPRAARPAH